MTSSIGIVLVTDQTTDFSEQEEFARRLISEFGRLEEQYCGGNAESVGQMGTLLPMLFNSWDALAAVSKNLSQNPGSAKGEVGAGHVE